VLTFVNLWGYSELKAALAITPIPIMAMIVSPLVGRISDRLPPRAFGIPALLVMAVGLFSLATLPAEPDFWAAAWRLSLLGIGVGATFPAVMIGSMGSIRGTELGLGSGIVNMSRQVGFAIGIALFVAVFTGAVDNQAREAQQRIAALPGGHAALSFNKDDPEATEVTGSGPAAGEARQILEEELRDAYGRPFLVGGFVTLLAVPFALTMRRRPSEAQAAPEVAAAAAAAGG
jgi:MFS family permease